MVWIPEQFLRRPDFDDLSGVHDREPVGEISDDIEVVRDEHVSDTESVLYIREQVEDRRLCCHVEIGHRFVKDDHVRTVREGSCQSDALELATGQFSGISVGDLWGEMDALQQAINLIVIYHVLGSRFGVVKGLGKRPTNRPPRIETLLNMLKHDTDSTTLSGGSLYPPTQVPSMKTCP